MAAEFNQMLAAAERGVAASVGIMVVDLVVEIDTSAIDVALAKVDELKAALRWPAWRRRRPVGMCCEAGRRRWRSQALKHCAAGRPRVR